MIKSLESKQIFEALPAVSLLLMALLITAGAEAAQGGNARMLLSEADRQYYQGNVQKSLGLYEEAVKADPVDAAALESLGVTYAETGEWEKARQSLERALAIEPKGEVHVNLSLIYSELKDNDRAVQHAEEAVKLLPKKPSAYHALGMAYENSGQDDKALGAYRRGLEADPKNADLLVTLGNLHVKGRRLDEAIAAYEKAIAADPKNVFPYSNAAYVLEERGQTEKAMRYLVQATEIAPADGTVWYDLGSAYLKKDQVDLAVGCFEKSLAADPKHYKSCLSLAMAYERKRDLEKAAEYYTKALSMTDDPKLRETILRLITTSSV